jgi:excinuclease ABC subunit C
MPRSKADHPGGPATRFDETAATATVRGAAGDAPDLEAGVAAIRRCARTLSGQPGVYRMLNAAGEPLYVGKARALRARVSTYAQAARLPNRLKRMVAQTRRVEVVTTASEAEALLLEAQLIKRFRPPYNVNLRDDKSYPFVRLNEGHAYPRISKHRGARTAGSRYYGPFASAGAVDQTLNALQKLFLLRSCSDSFFANRSRPCLLHQIKRCSAPCVGRIDAAGYAALVAEARDFLEGRSSAIQARLQGAMAEAAARQDYELAAVQRDRLKALAHVQGGAAAAATGVGDADIIAMAGDGGLWCVQLFFLRGGQNWGHRALFPSHTEEVGDEEVLASVIAQFYAELPPPPLILLDRMPAEAELIAQALSERAGRRVELRHGRRGAGRRLVEQAARNAAEALARRRAEHGTQAALLRELGDWLDLGAPPRRVEVYDNSHVQGAQAQGAMIVAGPEGFQKGQYRRFNMAAEVARGGDDFAMMAAMLKRRFARAVAEDPERAGWPDLLLIDGGKGQVAAVMAALGDLGVDEVPVVGVAKGPDRNAGREVFHFADGTDRMLPPDSPLLFFVQRLRDEAHRFAIGGHRAARGRAIVASPLDEVAGVGPARKRALLLHFGTARAVRGASLADLERAPGVSKAVARAVFDHFHPGG